MKVSVIIPNYNHGSFLEQRIDSVLNQTHQDIEVIILDDLSTDYSKTVIEKYRGNPKIAQIVYNEVNSGSAFRQWQKGLMMAKGEMIWLAESDDWCENNFLEVLLEGIQKHPDCVLAYCQTYCIDTANNIWWVTKGNNLEEKMEGKVFIEKHLLKGTAIVNASMAIFKRDAFLHMPPDFMEFRFLGDWLFWIETARQGNIFISGRVLNFFRRHDMAVSEMGHATGGDLIENLKIIRKLKEYSCIPERLYRQLVFMKYKKFTLNKKKYSPEAARRISSSFFEMFPDRASAKKYLWLMYAKSRFSALKGGKKG